MAPLTIKEESSRYWAGSIAVHKRINRHGFALPYHRAVKNVEAMEPDGTVSKTPAWKFETFIFDGLPLASKTCCVETLREEEFAPVKNKEGEDSPETARKAMVERRKRWLAAAGVRVAPDVAVEVSPLYALDQEELAAKVRGQNLAIDRETYLG